MEQKPSPSEDQSPLFDALAQLESLPLDAIAREAAEYDKLLSTDYIVRTPTGYHLVDRSNTLRLDLDAYLDDIEGDSLEEADHAVREALDSWSQPQACDYIATVIDENGLSLEADLYLSAETLSYEAARLLCHLAGTDFSGDKLQIVTQNELVWSDANTPKILSTRQHTQIGALVADQFVPYLTHLNKDHPAVREHTKD